MFIPSNPSLQLLSKLSSPGATINSLNYVGHPVNNTPILIFPTKQLIQIPVVKRETIVRAVKNLYIFLLQPRAKPIQGLIKNPRCPLRMVMPKAG
ncbi:MAG TPA: hypothetical protein DDW65_23160 [Firmicutes bacterium]|nr:hypothetical protein [Bacillota bacterium]